MLFFDPPSAGQIPSDITPSRRKKIPKHITELTKQYKNMTELLRILKIIRNGGRQVYRRLLQLMI